MRYVYAFILHDFLIQCRETLSENTPVTTDERSVRYLGISAETGTNFEVMYFSNLEKAIKHYNTSCGLILYVYRGHNIWTTEFCSYPEFEESVPTVFRKKEYSETVKEIVASAFANAEEMKAKGWTKVEAAELLKEMFEGTGGLPD